MDVCRFPRRRGVLSVRQVSVHKQRKVARAVTARKLLILAEQWAHQDRPRRIPRLRREKRRVAIRPVGWVEPQAKPIMAGRRNPSGRRQRWVSLRSTDRKSVV